jgi:FAD:protein FMN transferase
MTTGSQRTFRAMGSQILVVADSDNREAQSLLDQVPGWFEDWEQQLSRFRPTSELQLLNAQHERWVFVGDALWDVIELACQSAEQSDGIVTPTVLDALEHAGYGESFVAGRMVGAQSVVQCAPVIADWRAIERDPRLRAIRLPAGLRLDLGGVAKGWAAEQARCRLEGRAAVLVDAGGDVVTSGPRADGTPWPVGVGNPWAPEQSIDLVALAGEAIATSGRDYRCWQQGDLWQHHLIDPRSGRPAETDLISATVIAPTIGRAEMAAKRLLITGKEAGIAWIDNQPDLAALAITEGGVGYTSRGWRHYRWKES